MQTVSPLIDVRAERTPRAAIFLSGSGSNAERIIERLREAGPEAPFAVCALVTDAPEHSRARELADAYGIALVEHDIRRFYGERGHKRVSIMTAEGRQIREQWTDDLRLALQPRQPDFGVLAGFVPLTNITGDFPCLNVHPGDLTYEKDGGRYLVGLHTAPIERAILEGLDSLRSSVIVAQPYTGSGGEMDSGPILGISEPVPVSLQGVDLAELKRCATARPARRPPGGFGDVLERIAAANQTNLKEQGDWIVFPQAVFEFAGGRFAEEADGGLCYRTGSQWHPVETVVFGRDRRELVFRSRLPE